MMRTYMCSMNNVSLANLIFKTEAIKATSKSELSALTGNVNPAEKTRTAITRTKYSWNNAAK